MMKRARSIFDGETPRVRPCDIPGCAEAGLHRAPKSVADLGSFHWFCLEHVRAYNADWDYFKDMSEAQIDFLRREDSVWQRPTWPFSRAGDNTAHRAHFKDPFGFFSEAPGNPGGTSRSSPNAPETAALAELDLQPGADLDTVKARYKELAKVLHPDRNGGDPVAEERLKRINQAYGCLKKSFTRAL